MHAGMFDRVVLDRDTLVSLMWANNETGVLFPIETLSPKNQGPWRVLSHGRRAGYRKNYHRLQKSPRRHAVAFRA